MKSWTPLLLLSFMIGCDSSEDRADDFVPDTRIHELPISKANFSCDQLLVEISGGDLMDSADRIVVGTVTSVEAVQEFLPGSTARLNTRTGPFEFDSTSTRTLKGAAKESS